MNKLLVILSLALLSSCGSSDTPATSRPFFGAWASANTVRTFDFTGATFAAGQTVNYYDYRGGKCGCTGDFSGNESSAGLVLSGCSYTGGGAGDPGCAGLNATYTIQLTSSRAMVMCAGTSCTGYL